MTLPRPIVSSSRLSAEDGGRLERALALAERGRLTSAPNPVVGCVIAAPDGRVVGEGWHERAGGDHAERVALDDAGAEAAGATVYVTLEPCTHHGNTPPCADALVSASVARVVVGVGDPNPKNDGAGLEALREAGIQVDVATGELAWRARVQNEGFRRWVCAGRPFVTYKAAATLDGRLAASSGESRWVSGPESRRFVHEQRARADAVAVGMGTVRADHPLLTARDVEAPRQPRRLAFGRGPLPPESELELCTGPLRDELRRLADEGVQTLLLEGGPTLAASFLRDGLIDKLLLFVAPTLIGGDDGPPIFAGAGASRMDEATAVSHLSWEPVGADLMVTGYLREP